MPVFQETATSARDLRILPSLAPPLPRLTPRHEAYVATDNIHQHEVVVIGAGPSGLFLTLLLARYGITGPSLLCLDAKPGTLKAGQADGLQPRTLEVLQSLNIASEIISEGCHMEEVAFWNPMVAQCQENGQIQGIQRTDFVPDVNVPARFPFEVTIHQGRIERILAENLSMYSPSDTIRRSHRFINYEFDEAHPDFPIVVRYEYDSPENTTSQGLVRTKYLVGADGARSLVRKCMGLQLHGETTDHIWGVCDFVARTDFPDIRKRCAVHSDAGSVMVIPREQVATGEYLTRLYVQVPGETEASDPMVADKKEADKKRRGAVTLDYIFSQASKVFMPYKVEIKEGTEPDWWAAYQIGQRMTSKFSSRTPDGVDRVFIVGDACHTHSPKAGQGMNVSMMDSYNLAWKLAHSINGLTPTPKGESFDPVLATFGEERADVARQLIEFDTTFSHLFSGKIATDTGSTGLSHEEFLRVFREGSGFTSGCGLKYAPSRIVKTPNRSSVSTSITQDYLNGALTVGTRLLNVEVRRYADATTRQIHDEFPSTGRYRLLVFTGYDILDRAGTSQSALRDCTSFMKSFPKSSIELAVFHSISRRFEWVDLPTETKELAEMRTYGVAKSQDVYDTYGVSKEKGLIAILRPDGYIGALVPLSETQEANDYLRNCLVTV